MLTCEMEMHKVRLQESQEFPSLVLCKQLPVKNGAGGGVTALGAPQSVNEHNKTLVNHEGF